MQYRDFTVPQALLGNSSSHPERTFAHCGERTWTYGEMAERAMTLAAGLADLGVTKGERVAILTTNRPEMLEIFFGAALLGAVQVPLNAFLKGEFLRYQLDDCQTTTIIVDEAGYRAFEPLAGALPELKRVILLDGAARSPGGQVRGVAYGDLFAAGAVAGPVALTGEDLMSVVYTSGTTGLPKGCRLMHGYYGRMSTLAVEWHGITAHDVHLTAMPLFHAAARMGVVCAALQAGSAVAIMPEFSASRVLDEARRTGATVFGGVGAMGVALMATAPDARDRDHSLRTVWFVPYTVQQQEEFKERFGVDDVTTELYGQTECFPITFNVLAGPRNTASDGRAAPDLEVRVVDENDEDVPVGTGGEIIVRPRHRFAMFDGYWGKPTETLNAFRALWYRTGDFARWDADGYLYFMDRKKDTIRRRGENISSQELERAILSHPDICEVAVHAMASDVSEDDVKACIVLEPGADLTPEDLFEFFKGNLPYFALPRFVDVLDELPKNAVSRVMKHQLRERGNGPESWDFDALGLRVERGERR